MRPGSTAGRAAVMRIERHKDGERVSTALYSDCGGYRYLLSRVWAAQRGLANFVMLNPSVADVVKNDPTVERCERRAEMLGFGGYCVSNIFAWRDTDPLRMRKATHPVGPDNDRILLDEAQRAEIVIVAWGVHGAHRGRGAAVRHMFDDKGIAMHHLGLTRRGHPRHPLYASYACELCVWTAGPYRSGEHFRLNASVYR